jgi:hypothetical protein
MSKARLLLGFVGTALVIACGSSTPAPEAASGDFEVAASPAARAELGVTTWRGASPSPGTMTIRGVDASGATVIELETTSSTGTDGRHLKQRVSRGKESATVDVEPTQIDGAAHYTMANGVADASPALRRGLVRLLADLDAQKPLPVSTGLATKDVPSGQGSTQLVAGHCGFLVRCDTPPLVACTGGFIAAAIDCPSKLVVAAKDFFVNLGFDTSDPTESAKNELAGCGKAVGNAVDACDTTQSVRNGCQYGGTKSCPDVSMGDPNQACSPACDAVHSCVAMGAGDYGVPVSNGRGCLAN